MFAGLTWGQSPQEAKATLVAKGYEFTGIDKDGDYDFRTDIQGTPAVVWIFVAPQIGVVKAVVSMKPRESELFSTYRSIKATLIEKYGAPEKDYHYFSSPYSEGDGNETLAVFAGKAHFVAFWPSSPSAGTAYVEITQSERVAISYEAPQWPAEARRRKAKATNDL